MTFGNLLEQAHSLIPFQPFIWRRWLSQTLDSAMLRVNSYSAPISCQGSIQRVSQEIYERLGLDWEKNYRLVYASYDIRGLDGQESPDLLSFEGKNWKVIRVTPWFGYDGWNEVLVVEDNENELEK